MRFDNGPELVALEVHRFDFCFIGAGYEREVDEFLTVNSELAGRFNSAAPLSIDPGSPLQNAFIDLFNGRLP
jgi:hypothetical protein